MADPVGGSTPTDTVQMATLPAPAAVTRAEEVRRRLLAAEHAEQAHRVEDGDAAFTDAVAGLARYITPNPTAAVTPTGTEDR